MVTGKFVAYRQVSTICGMHSHSLCPELTNLTLQPSLNLPNVSSDKLISGQSGIEYDEWMGRWVIADTKRTSQFFGGLVERLLEFDPVSAI